MADDLDMSGLRLDGMPVAQTPMITNIDQADVLTLFLKSPHAGQKNEAIHMAE